jgi:uncharacterized protein (TIGR02246 family)
VRSALDIFSKTTDHYGDFMADQKTPMCESRPPLPPFTCDTAIQKVRLAEDGWNSRDPEKVALAYTPDSQWRNRSEFVRGRQEIVAFLTRKWAKELDYRLIKELCTFAGDRIAVRFAYEGKLVISFRRGAIHWKSVGGIANGFIQRCTD